MYPEPDSGTDYSGRGLVMFPPSGSATFYVEVPRDYQYELILRIQVYNILALVRKMILSAVIINLPPLGQFNDAHITFSMYIFPLQPPAIIDGVNVFIESQSPVGQGLDCSPIASDITSSFLVPFPSSSADYIVIDTVCMVAGVVYSVQVQYLNVESSQWMLDSVRATLTQHMYFLKHTCTFHYLVLFQLI